MTGMILYGWVWSLLEEGSIFFGAHRDGIQTPAPAVLHTPSFVAYEIPHLLMNFGFVVMSFTCGDFTPVRL